MSHTGKAKGEPHPNRTRDRACDDRLIAARGGARSVSRIRMDIYIVVDVFVIYSQDADGRLQGKVYGSTTA